MSELTAAMQAALDSVDERRRRADQPSEPAVSSSSGVRLRDETELPPIVGPRGPRTFTETLRDQYGPLVVTAWVTVREALLMVVLFWVCAILLAFVEVEGAVQVPGVGEATVITVSIVAAVCLRGVLAAASRSGQALEARRR